MNATHNSKVPDSKPTTYRADIFKKIWDEVTNRSESNGKLPNKRPLAKNTSYLNLKTNIQISSGYFVRDAAAEGLGRSCIEVPFQATV